MLTEVVIKTFTVTIEVDYSINEKNKKLPLAHMITEGKAEEYPKLTDVFKVAGITEFSEVTLTGSASP